jgi:hypothetical protein
MYKGIGDDKNRINVISSETPNVKAKVQNGAYEQYILCSDCDNNILSKLERYANNHLYSQPYREDNDKFEQITNIHGINVIRCKHLDFSGYKLFLESLLWRASVSTHGLFQNFKLSNEQEEMLRNSIYSSTPLEVDDFLCMITTHPDNEQVETDLVFVNDTKPNKVSFFINQFIYLFYLDKNLVDEALKEVAINKNNSMGIAKLPNGEWAKIRASVFTGVAEIAKRNL